MKSFFPILLPALAFCMACVHEPEEIPTLPALPLFKDATPISQIKEPGCELQMELDPLWHHNQYRDSNYIRDLIVNPNNTNQWIYIQDVLTIGEDWSILWFVDLEKREKKQLDSISFYTYGDLTWGGQYVGFGLGHSAGIINIQNGSHLQIPNSSYVEISPTGEYIFYAEKSQPMIAQLHESGIHNPSTSDVGRVFQAWSETYSMYTLKNNEQPTKLELGTYNVQSKNFTSKFIYESKNPFIECLSLSGNQIFFSRHNTLDLTTQSYTEFFPFCDRQYFERIIPLTKTREYLVIKSYRETIEPKTTLVYQHFHVFDENWENERRVTLNFDF